ncbi:MAG: DHH family phosphoesterase, partial [Pirellulales bacterium]
MPKCWRIQPHDAATVSRLERAVGVSPVLARLLATRGVAEAEARIFLAGSLSDLRDPELLPGVAEAADRILAATKAGRRICIYGDYDADGMTATAILASCLQAIHADVFWYVPDRFDEGYGLNAEALRTIQGKGASLVVTVDCGIASVVEADVARELGLELIITDL